MTNKNHVKHTNTQRGQNTGVLTHKRKHKWLKIKYFKHYILLVKECHCDNRGVTREVVTRQYERT